jgi:hypothetical protein
MSTDAIVTVDTSEAQKKLDEILEKLERIYALIDRSWLLRLIFYGLRRLT